MSYKSQVNLRLSEQDIQQIDRKRIQLQKTLGRIPSRSEVMRMALDGFLSARRTAKKK